MAYRPLPGGKTQDDLEAYLRQNYGVKKTKVMAKELGVNPEYITKKIAYFGLSATRVYKKDIDSDSGFKKTPTGRLYINGAVTRHLTY